MALSLHENGLSSCSPRGSGGRLLLTARSEAEQTGRKDFVLRGGESTWYILTVSSEVSARIFVTISSYRYARTRVARKMLLREAFVKKAIEVLPRSVLVGPGYVQHEGNDWCCEHCARYHSYLIPEKHDLPNVIDLAYGGGATLRVEKHSLPTEKTLDKQFGDTGEQTRIRRGSSRSSESGKSGLELSLGLLEARYIPENQ